mmetsp:Transcript_774/g.1774  ORF Transcript_774/g.1774 Transcript_774/m.1774 type:complete len:244 (-) Transcript_774:112-843(-)
MLSKSQQPTTPCSCTAQGRWSEDREKGRSGCHVELSLMGRSATFCSYRFRWLFLNVTYAKCACSSLLDASLGTPAAHESSALRRQRKRPGRGEHPVAAGRTSSFTRSANIGSMRRSLVAAVKVPKAGLMLTSINFACAWSLTMRSHAKSSKWKGELLCGTLARPAASRGLRESTRSCSRGTMERPRTSPYCAHSVLTISICSRVHSSLLVPHFVCTHLLVMCARRSAELSSYCTLARRSRARS